MKKVFVSMESSIILQCSCLVRMTHAFGATSRMTQSAAVLFLSYRVVRLEPFYNLYSQVLMAHRL